MGQDGAVHRVVGRGVLGGRVEEGAPAEPVGADAVGDGAGDRAHRVGGGVPGLAHGFDLGGKRRYSVAGVTFASATIRSMPTECSPSA